MRNLYFILSSSRRTTERLLARFETNGFGRLLLLLLHFDRRKLRNNIFYYYSPDAL